MKLNDLAPVEDDSTVTGFALDHRKVVRGNVFGAFRGEKFNGEDFVEGAVRNGAIAVVARPEARIEGAVHIADAEPRRRFATMAARFFGPYPETIVAVTGTNGKTSTVEMTRQLWRMAGHRSASIGTLGVTTADDQVKTGLTTPDIVTFLSNVSGLRRMGIDHVAYEASSHGLDQYRAEGVPLKAIAFTNFSRDHLDYHPSMEAYFDAKMRLFGEVAGDDSTAVIWADDPKSGEVIARCGKRGLKLLTVGEKGDAIRLVSRKATPLGQQLVLIHDGAEHKMMLPLIGAYQVNNVLTAAGLVLATCGRSAAAVRGSDVVIVTDDNPRSEDPAVIRQAIMADAPGAIEIGGRREAIAEAVRMAKSGDIILLAGKGHETGQIVGNQVFPFDDAEVARECAA